MDVFDNIRDGANVNDDDNDSKDANDSRMKDVRGLTIDMGVKS